MGTCTSCNKEVSGDYIEFRCPKCGKQKIIRCINCRENERTYSCKECNFEGP